MRIINLFVLILVILSYHDAMTRLAQRGYVDGYVEGMSVTEAKLHDMGALSEDMAVRLGVFISLQHYGYEEAYKEHGGFL